MDKRGRIKYRVDLYYNGEKDYTEIWANSLTEAKFIIEQDFKEDTCNSIELIKIFEIWEIKPYNMSFETHLENMKKTKRRKEFIYNDNCRTNRNAQKSRRQNGNIHTQHS